MQGLLIESGYNVTVTSSLANALFGIIKQTAQVVLVGTRFDNLAATDIIPLLKQCNHNLSIIFVSAETSLPFLRKLRSEGIFYHTLKPQSFEDREELRQVVRCAFETVEKSGGTR
jgi:DNA-binding NtrC family response regulator